MSERTIGHRPPNWPYEVRRRGRITFALGQDCAYNGLVHVGPEELPHWFELLFQFNEGMEEMFLYTLHPLTAEQREEMLRNEDQLLDLRLQPLSSPEKEALSKVTRRTLVDRQEVSIVRHVGPVTAFSIEPLGALEPAWRYPVTRTLAGVFERMRGRFPSPHPAEVELLFSLSEMHQSSGRASAPDSRLRRTSDGLLIERNWPGVGGPHRRCESFLSGHECSRAGVVSGGKGRSWWYDLVADSPKPTQRMLYYALHLMDAPAYHRAFARARHLNIPTFRSVKRRVQTPSTESSGHGVAEALAREIRAELGPPLQLLVVEESLACPGWSIPINNHVMKFCDWLRDCYPDAPQPLLVELLATLSELGANDGGQ